MTMLEAYTEYIHFHVERIDGDIPDETDRCFYVHDAQSGSTLCFIPTSLPLGTSGHSIILADADHDDYLATFDDWIPQLIAMAEPLWQPDLYGEYPGVGFVTAWRVEYGKEEDTHVGSGEYYLTWELLGLCAVNLPGEE